MPKGKVYLLTNEAMPGYVKIGLTTQDDILDRIRQLDTTGVPMPFDCYYIAEVPDERKLERTLHFVFGEKRSRKSREFFKIDPDLAKAIIELVATSPIKFTDSEQNIEPEVRQEAERIRNRRENKTFRMANIPDGETLTFTKDSSVTCQVVGEKRVLFQGQQMSISAAALKAVKEMGYEWETVNGWEYWEWKGSKISSLCRPSQEDSEDS